MAKSFLDYQEMESDNSQKDQQENVQELIDRIKRFSKMVKKQEKQLKRVKKKIRKEKKILLEMQKGQNVSANEEKAENMPVVKEDAKKQGKTFLEKVGEAFVKALPSIFRTIASVAVAVIFGNNSGWFGKKGKVQRANSRL